jgi:hypothetical protein
MYIYEKKKKKKFFSENLTGRDCMEKSIKIDATVIGSDLTVSGQCSGAL